MKLKSDNRTFLQTRNIDNNLIVNTCYNSAKAATYEYWHSALGHPSVTTFNPDVYKDGNQIPQAPGDFESTTCGIAKLKYSVPSPTERRVQERFDLRDSDICGPIPDPSLDGHRYVLTVIDDFT